MKNTNTTTDPELEILPAPTSTSSRVLKSMVVILVAILSALYLLNPTAGIIELIPDNIPGIGNLDEVAATVLLLSCLAYFGIDLRPFLKTPPRNTRES